VRIGTRGSDLALVQAAATERALARARGGLRLQRRVIRTLGDRRTDVALSEVARKEGGIDKGVFTKELEVELERGGIDLAVHSLKDLPTVLDEGFELVGTLPRAAIRDVLVSRHEGGLEGLGEGCRVGTSSVRRARQLEWLRPDLVLADLRGNVPTRVAKLARGDYDAILLAEAGLRRLGMMVAATRVVAGTALHFTALPEEEFYPAASQGAIGLEIRAGDAGMRELVESLRDADGWTRVTAEREFLRLLDAGCHTPVGVFSALEGGRLRMAARVFPEAGGEPRCARAEGAEPLAVARQLFDSLA